MSANEFIYLLMGVLMQQKYSTQWDLSIPRKSAIQEVINLGTTIWDIVHNSYI